MGLIWVKTRRARVWSLVCDGLRVLAVLRNKILKVQQLKGENRAWKYIEKSYDTCKAPTTLRIRILKRLFEGDNRT